MDRINCTLVYSDYSPACRQLCDTIRALPYDLARLAGIGLLNVDSPVVRDRILRYGVNDVPTLFLRYYDGRDSVLTGADAITKWIDSVTDEIIGQPRVGANDDKDEPYAQATACALSSLPSHATDASSTSRSTTASAASTQPQTRVGRSMSEIAMDMQAMRDKEDEARPRPPFGAMPTIARFGK